VQINIVGRQNRTINYTSEGYYLKVDSMIYLKQELSLKKTNAVGFKKGKYITQGKVLVHKSYTDD